MEEFGMNMPTSVLRAMNYGDFRVAGESMRKRLLLLLSLAFAFLMCSSCNNVTSHTGDIYNKNPIYISAGIYEDKTWKRPDDLRSVAVVENKEVAMKIAQAVYDGQLRHKKLPVFRWSNVAIDDDYVTYNQDKVCWEIRFASYTEKEDGEIVFGGSLIEISISSYDGTILECDFID